MRIVVLIFVSLKTCHAGHVPVWQVFLHDMRQILPCMAIRGRRKERKRLEMADQFSRTKLLLGDAGVERLKRARVAVFGVGGVGGYAVEALARSGVGAIDLIDHDKVSRSNLNRQIIATASTIGRYKVDVMRERILDINADAAVTVHRCFFLPETAGEFDFSAYSYVVDVVDTVTAKIALVMEAQRAGVPIISSMGAGNKLDASAFEVADIYETSVCPLARVMRRELKKRGIPKLKVVYSREKPREPMEMDGGGGDVGGLCVPTDGQPGGGRRAIPGSVAFVPSVAGLILAGEVIRDLAQV